MNKIRVLLVDDNKMVREGLAQLLHWEADIEIVGFHAEFPEVRVIVLL